MNVFISPALSLNIWSNSSDPYSHEDLATNFLRIDQSDHSPGRGVQIPTAGIQDQAITISKIAPGAITSSLLAANIALPAGVVLPYAGNIIPTGFLACNGQIISRSTYSALFSAIGTNYPGGDGLTTFAVPNTEDIVLAGAGNLYTAGETGGNATATLATSNVPSHTHNVVYENDGGAPLNMINGHAWVDTSGGAGSASTIASTPAGAFAAGLVTDAGNGAGSPFSVLSPFLAMLFIIKI